MDSVQPEFAGPSKAVSALIQEFFTLNPADLQSIISELIAASVAEQALSPGRTMSRNYETAQENPEINTRPGNLRDARDAIFPYYWGTDGWQSALHLENVKGPPNTASLIGSIAALIKNPNLCVDTYCQRSNELEVKSIMALANLIFYHTSAPWGTFTIGGTISNLYAGKIGIERAFPGTMQTGLNGKRVAGVVSAAGHYSNATVAGWLGMGTDNLIAIPTDSSMSMRLDILEQRIEELYQQGITVAFVIATFGTTDAFGIDNIPEIRIIIDRLAMQYQMPIPYLHVDAAVGWVAAFFAEYAVHENPLAFPETTVARIALLKDATKGFRLVDSVTIDFHKMGWGHYPSSAFIVRNRQDLALLTRSLKDVPYFAEADFRHDPALFTLECSRPGIGPYSVMASLNSIGLTGYQHLIGWSITLADELKRRIDALPYCKVINATCAGPSVCWWVMPKGRDAKAIYDGIVSGEIPTDQANAYFAEISNIYSKREYVMDPAQDARLSYTNSIGFKPNGQSLPAWKAVFFNPKSDAAIIDRIIQSIESAA